MSARERDRRRWLRRAVTVPAYFTAAFLLAPSTLLVGLPLAAAFDFARSNRWATSRALVFLSVYFLCEAFGIIAAAALWTGHTIGGRWTPAQYQRRNFRLQCLWASTLHHTLQATFSLTTEVRGTEVVRRGPYILFPRHVSTGDTILPAAIISDPFGVVLRYVLKRELLWDPCLDIVGHRLRNVFVARNSDRSAEEIAHVAELADDLGTDEGVLIYPEGTRFSESKRRRAIDRLEAQGERRLASMASAMKNVLPPRLGGPLALIRRNRGADVVFLAHRGFEGIKALSDLFDGSMIGRAIQVELWRVPSGEIPQDIADLRVWLYEQWQRVDRWVAGHIEEHPCDERSEVAVG